MGKRRGLGCRSLSLPWLAGSGSPPAAGIWCRFVLSMRQDGPASTSAGTFHRSGRRKIPRLISMATPIDSLYSFQEVSETKVIEIEGIGPVNAEKLAGAGITTVEGLLEKGASPKGRKAIAAATGISEALVLRWVNYADLFRIRGVGTQYSELLESAGVDTVVELSKRVPANLTKKMNEVNLEKKLVRKVPALSLVESWVEQAKALPRVVTH